MRKALTDLLYPLYDKLGLDTVTEKMRMLRKVNKYLEQDREHFVEIESPEDPPFISDPERGLIGKLAPVAQRQTIDEDDFHMESVTETVSVMVTNDNQLLLLYSIERAYLSKTEDEWSFRFPTYRTLEPDLPTDGLEVCSPEFLRPIADAHYWDAYCKAFYAFERLTRHMHPTYVPHKTERAMIVLKHANNETLFAGDMVFHGKVVPLAIGSDPVVIRDDEGETKQSEQLCLLVEDQDVRYLMKTITAYTPAKKTPYGNDPLDIFDLPEETQTKETYREIHLEEIDMQLLSLYN
ncbi:MAG: hypothetical protein IKU07_07370 [Oscillospiraceae bacterium]|nr:hypothetical protein [Oscillospiraceae bacterium]